MVVLLSWLALGVIVVALLNLAKMIVRSAARRNRTAVSTGGQVLASVDGRQSVASSFGPPRRYPSPATLPPPQPTRRSA